MTPEEVRQRLVDALEADLVGPFVAERYPGGGQEVLQIPPSRWYLTGFLAPQFDRAPEVDDPDTVDDLARGNDSQAEDAGSGDEPEAKRPHRFRASMGLPVFLPAPAAGGEDDPIDVELAFAEYIKEPIAEDTEKRARAGWRRVRSAPGTSAPRPSSCGRDPRAAASARRSRPSIAIAARSAPAPMEQPPRQVRRRRRRARVHLERQLHQPRPGAQHRGRRVHDATFAAQLERQWLGHIKAGLVLRWDGGAAGGEGAQ